MGRGLRWTILALAILWAGGLRLAIWWREQPETAERDEDDDGEFERKRAELLALVPKPSAPSRTVGASDAETFDPSGVVPLLRAGRTAELDALLSGAQELLERDVTKEHVVERLFRPFEYAGNDLLPLIDAWRAKMPDSAPAHVAWASVIMAEAWREPPDSCNAEGRRVPSARARKLYGKAESALESAVSLRPALVFAHAELIYIAALSDESSPRIQLDRAVRACPACSGPREKYLFRVKIDADGSYDQLKPIAEDAQEWAGDNPRLRALLGYADLRLCAKLEWDDQLGKALAACERACAVFPNPRCEVEKAGVLRRLDREADALRVVDGILAMDPSNVGALIERARVHEGLEHFEEAGKDALRALELAPGHDGASTLLVDLMQWLEWRAEGALRDSDLEGALRAYDTALRIVPGYQEIERPRKAVARRAGLIDTESRAL